MSERRTVRELQETQPWTVPYSHGVMTAASSGELVPHILGSHCALHAAKTTGKLCAVFEAADHAKAIDRQAIKDMAADLLAEALRFANLYDFDLETEHARRVSAKNGTP